MEWKVYEIYCCGLSIWKVGRLKHPNQPEHSGNIEYVELIFNNEYVAKDYAKQLNAQI